MNINAILSSILIAVVLWFGNKTQVNNDALTEIKTQLPYVNQSIVDLRGQLTAMVTRSELESRFAEFTVRDATLEKKITMLEMTQDLHGKPKEAKR